MGEHNIKATSILRTHRYDYFPQFMEKIKFYQLVSFHLTYCELASYEKYSVPHISDKEFTQFVLCELQNPASMHLKARL